MIVDADTVEMGACLRADVCMVGGGAAGIPLALALVRPGLEVSCCSRSGRLRCMRRPRPCMPARSPTSGCTARPTNTGSGAWAAPRRSGAAAACRSTRSISKRAARCRTAAGRLSLRGSAALLSAGQRAGRSRPLQLRRRRRAGPGAPPMIRGFDSALVRTNALERFSCPTDFGRRYARRLASRRRPEGAAGRQLHGDAAGGRTGRPVDELEVGRWPGGEFRVAVPRRRGGDRRAGNGAPAARLARRGTGGHRQRTRRRGPLLHVPHRRQRRQARDQWRPARRAPRLRDHARRHLLPAPSWPSWPSEQRRRGLANAVARLHFPRITDPAHRNGVLSGLFLARR